MPILRLKRFFGRAGGPFERNVLYTAVTRERKLVVIVGQPKALAIAVRTYARYDD